ncbi:MAG: exodeoxyribonuclease 7 large subunit [Leptospiraceae bacterium]|nr:MAG: exodeoxyribonuclease 7 large subunit [Leptospiraceae bacterium]
MDLNSSEEILLLLKQVNLEDEEVYTPKQIIEKLYDIINEQSELKGIWIEGEIYNYKKISSGHIYFSLKDEESNLECVYFSFNQNKNKYPYSNVELKDGKVIRAYGKINLYKKNGHCQLNVEKVAEINHIGNIFKKIKELREKLEKEGLFSPERKKKLPVLPINLGIATSDSGAALKDIIKIAKSRFRDINIYIAPCQVQGEKAKESIIKAIQILNKPEYQIDVIILGRGGGSFEDLFIFNDEKIIRAIANSRVPIISAVGHQIDRPLCELVADDYAITPSEAAQKFIPDIDEKINLIENYIIKMQNILHYRIQGLKEKYNTIANFIIWKEPKRLISQPLKYLEQLENRIKVSMKYILQKNKQQFTLLEEKLKQLNPYAPLERGYAYVTDKNEKIIKKGEEIKENDTIFIHFLKDKVHARVEKIVKVPEKS